jgi:manganese transport protein
MSSSTARKASSPIVTLHLSNVVRPRAGLRLAISNGRFKLALLGPAFVVAIGYIDPGNYATNIQAGAEYGYLLLWVVLWGNLMAAHIQLLSSKLGLATRTSLASLLRDHLPPWGAFLYWIQAEVLAIATDLAEFVGGSLGFQLLFGMSLLEGAICTGILSWVILMLEQRGLKRLEAAIAGMLSIVALIYIAELVFSHPAPRAVVVGTLLPRFAGAHSLYLAAGILGATVMPHVIYLHSALSRADADSNGALTPGSLFRASRWDVAIAMTIAGFVNLAMLAMAGAVFHRPHGASVGDIAVAYKTMEPILGPVAMHMFGASLIVAGVSSTVVGTLAGQEVMQGFVRFRIPLWLRRVLTMAPSFAVILLGFNVTDVLVLSQVILSFGITLAIVPLVIFTSRRSIMGELVNSRLVTLTSLVIVGLVVALNVFLLSAVRG